MGVDTSLDFEGAFTTGEASGSVLSNPVPAPQPVEHVGKPATETYIVQSGDTLSGIASKFGTTVSGLVSLNYIANPNVIYVGQKIILGGTGQSNAYTVQSGDTLSGIALSHRTT